MKKIILSIIATGAILVGCNGVSPNEYKVSAEFTKLADSTAVFFKQIDTLGRPVDIDTAYVKNNKVDITGKITEPALTYLIVDGVRGGVPFILEEGKIDIKFDKDSIFKSTFGGTKSNEDFYTIFDHMGKASDTLNKINVKMRELQKAQNFEALKELNQTQVKLRQEADDFEMDFAKSHNHSFVSLLILQNNLKKGPQYFGTIDSIFQGLDANLKTNPVGKKIDKALAAYNSTKIGAVAPGFTAKSLDGTDLALNDVKGKVTMIDFWASWCKPCRQENPNVLKVYNAYHNDGFNILGVSTDRNEDQWKQAVAADSLAWNQVIATQDIAMTYNIRRIPSAFILNGKGEIIAKDLRGAELEAEIAKALGVENKHVVPKVDPAAMIPMPSKK